MTSYGKLSSAYNELYIQENYGVATQTYPWNWGDGWSLDPARERCKNDNYGRDCRQIGLIMYPSCKGGTIDNSKNFFPYREQGFDCTPNLCLEEIPGENWNADPTNKNQQTKKFKEISRGSSANCKYVYPEDSDKKFTTLSYTTTGDKNIKVTRKCNTTINCEGVYDENSLTTKDNVTYYKNRTEIKVPACSGGLASTCRDTINVITLQNIKHNCGCQYPGREYKASYGKLSNGLDCKCVREGFWRCTQPKK